jgi:hypothetical protein
LTVRDDGIRDVRAVGGLGISVEHFLAPEHSKPTLVPGQLRFQPLQMLRRMGTTPSYSWVGATLTQHWLSALRRAVVASPPFRKRLRVSQNLSPA